MKNLLVFLIFLSQGFCLANPNIDLEVSPDESQKVKNIKINKMSDLQKLTPVQSISVIQKRYLPKTFRGEFNLSASSIINHTFFYLGGISGRLGFFIRENHGLGIEGFALLPPIFKPVTNELVEAPNNIQPYNIFHTQFYGGAYYKWSPVYGKFAVLNKKIIYFDTYMTVGVGMNQLLDGIKTVQKKLRTRGQKFENEDKLSQLTNTAFPAATVSLGQIFSISQNWAFNWELKWLFTFITKDSGGYGSVESEASSSLRTSSDINLSLGVNYYFPGAKYR